MDSARYRAIQSGQERGINASLWRRLFCVVTIFYRFGAAFKNFLYDRQICRIQRLDVPVISVGNLTLGGTGKSPLIAYLVDYYLRLGAKPAILSRGYGAKKEKTPEIAEPFLNKNDEAAELAEHFPDVPHFLSPDRFRAGKALLQEFPQRNVVLLDDGFQHRRLHRDLDIVLIDATDTFGGEALFPQGTLRESPMSLRRCDAVLLTRADLVSDEERRTIRKRVESIAPGKIWGEIAYRPIHLVRQVHSALIRRPLNPDQNRSKFNGYFSFCGIGNPDGFYRTLDRVGFEQIGRRTYPDHYHYTPKDLEKLAKEARSKGAEFLVCTMKDLVKIRQGDLGGVPLVAVEIGVQFLAGEEELQALLSDQVKRP